MLAVTVFLAMVQVDPMRLAIGTELTVQPGSLVDLRTQRPATVEDVAKAADGKRWVFLGENHATTAHQQMHADVIEALVKRKRRVVIGLEMLTRPKQAALETWQDRRTTEASLLEAIDWKGQWGFDFAFYRPIFNAARKHRLPMVALNVPRDWVRAVGRGGVQALTSEQRAELPAEMPILPEHEQVFNALIGGHPMAGERGRNMIAAQTLWDEGMADTAIKWLAARPSDARTVFVVLAGSGHVMYGQGINARVKRRTGEDGISVVMAQSDAPAAVSRGIADFLYLTRPEKKE